jgi:hypothetical protein
METVHQHSLHPLIVRTWILSGAQASQHPFSGRGGFFGGEGYVLSRPQGVLILLTQHTGLA